MGIQPMHNDTGFLLDQMWGLLWKIPLKRAFRDHNSPFWIIGAIMDFLNPQTEQQYKIKKYREKTPYPFLKYLIIFLTCSTPRCQKNKNKKQDARRSSMFQTVEYVSDWSMFLDWSMIQNGVCFRLEYVSDWSMFQTEVWFRLEYVSDWSMIQTEIWFRLKYVTFYQQKSKNVSIWYHIEIFKYCKI